MRIFCVSVAFLLSPFVGCDTLGPQVGSVAGRVTFEAKPVTSGTVVFENPSLAWISAAELDSEGHYELRDIRVAQYTVSVQPPPPNLPDDSGTLEEIRQQIKQVKPADPKNIPRPVRSTQTSPLRADVVEGEQEYNFELADAARS